MDATLSDARSICLMMTSMNPKHFAGFTVLALLSAAAWAEPPEPTPAPATQPTLPAWRTDPVWLDGLAEKATYRASRVIDGQARPYTAIFVTSKEQHDRNTWTRAVKSEKTLAVFKLHQIEDIPTPNSTQHFVTTSHFTAEAQRDNNGDITTTDMLLTRFDQSAQDVEGTSFRQLMPVYDRPGPNYALQTFSYMPEAGRAAEDLNIARGRRLVPEDSLPLLLRDFPFEDPKAEWKLDLLPTQKSNRPAPTSTVQATVKSAGMDNGAFRLELRLAGKPAGNPKNPPPPAPPNVTLWFAPDRLHVLVRYEAADKQTYELQSVERTEYGTSNPAPTK